MTAVSLQCKVKNHHPEWSNVYSTTFVRWTTHDPQGLSEKDITLAAVCDALAADFGELPPDPDTAAAMKALADQVTEVGADCCKRK
ncbi:hypothetical protein G7046_g10161 [Stylonectria norvegica]|nr:hypothetical protein G7046_g10161 [Stylonectria norvegica]